MEDLEKTISKSDMCGGKGETHAQDLAILSHDIRTHLSPAKICAEMLMSHISGPLTEKQDKMVLTISQCIGRLEDLIRDVSDMHKIESKSLALSKDVVSVRDLMDDCTVLLRPLISEKQIELKIEVDSDDEINIDKDRMCQVLVNLVKNAVDHVPDIDGKISIAVKRDPSHILFVIEDNGVGIQNEDLEKIFSKFFRGSSARQRKYGGSGLGLAICRGIVLEHGGKIWAVPRQGKGALLKFTVPA